MDRVLQRLPGEVAEEGLSNKWPWNDSTQGRLRRIIESYRLALLEHAPQVCEAIDKKMVAYGQKWVCSETVIERERLVTASEVAEEFGIQAYDLRNWSKRHPDEIPRRGTRGNQIIYRLGDILLYMAKHRIG